jgi:Amidohydrolase
MPTSVTVPAVRAMSKAATMSAGDAGALDHRLAHAAAADLGHARAGRDLGGGERGAQAGGDPAAEQGELLVGQAGPHRHQRRLVHHHGLGERAATADRCRSLAVAELEPERGLHAGVELAVGGHPVDAPPAGPAGPGDRGEHPVARPDPAHLSIDKAAALGRRGPMIGGRLPDKPSEALARHLWVCPFPEDDVDALIDAIGPDHVLFGSDWPHPEGLREPEEYLSRLAGRDPVVTRQVLRGNTAGLLGLPDGVAARPS